MTKVIKIKVRGYLDKPKILKCYKTRSGKFVIEYQGMIFTKDMLNKMAEHYEESVNESK